MKPQFASLCVDAEAVLEAEEHHGGFYHRTVHVGTRKSVQAAETVGQGRGRGLRLTFLGTIL